MNLLDRIKIKFPFLNSFSLARKINADSHFKAAKSLNSEEVSKLPTRTTIINYLLQQCEEEGNYLEIGVRNPDDNFNHINSQYKYSVDPGIEYKENPVDYKMTSDVFFEKLKLGEILSKKIKFQVIFIDGLHEAKQVDNDIRHAMEFISEDGFIVLHDCNPLTEWHARSDYAFDLSPAGGAWNGSVWKAFVKWRQEALIYSCCVDSDWGVGIISKNRKVGEALQKTIEFYDYKEFAKERENYLGLITFEQLKSRLSIG